MIVISFNDADVKVDLNNVLMAIEGWIERNNPLPPFSKGELPTHFEEEPFKLYQTGAFFTTIFYADGQFSGLPIGQTGIGMSDCGEKLVVLKTLQGI